MIFKYVFTQPLCNKQDVIQGWFWIQCSLSLFLLTKRYSLPYYLLIMRMGERRNDFILCQSWRTQSILVFTHNCERREKRWIHALPRLKNTVYPTIYSYLGFMPFWRALVLSKTQTDSPVQDLNSDCWFHFLWW